MIKCRNIFIALVIISSTVVCQTTISIGKAASPGILSREVLLPVNVSVPLNYVKSISFQFSYDDDIVTFDHRAAEIRSGIRNISLPDVDNLFVSANEGIISLSWTNSTSLSGVTLNGKIFDLDFDFTTGFSEVRFISATIKNMQGQKLTFSLEHGCISTSTDPAVKVIYPNGGQIIEVVGMPTVITWTNVYISNVNLEYSDDDGLNWYPIVSNYEAVKDNYQWTVPETINSTNCKIKITDVTPGSVSDESDEVFTINSTPIITLLTPNGIEELQSGGVKTIKWTSKNINNIKLEYCIGASQPAPEWKIISESIPARNCSYEWIIPNSVSNDCKVRVTDISHPSVFDLSDGIIKIHNNPICLTVSNTVDAKVQIIGKVIDMDLLGDKYWWWKPSDSWQREDAHYSEDGVEYDAKDTLNIAGTVQVNAGWFTSLQYLEMTISYDPNVLILDKLIPITDLKTINYSFNDGIIHVIWGTSSPQDIHGKLFDLKFRYIKFTNPLQWLNDGWDYFTHPSGDPNTPTAAIDPRNFSDIKIEMVSAKNSRNKLIDASNLIKGSLAISSNAAVKILSPAHGDTLEVNDGVYNILWSSRLVDNITLSYSTNNGTDWSSIISSTASNTGLYAWTLPNVNSTDCLVKIADASNSSIDDETLKFTLTNIKTLNLSSPDGGEILKSGMKKYITWSSRNINNIKLEYSTNIDTTWKLIAAGRSAKDYKYEWVIPVENSTNCKVRIRDVSDTTITDQSAAVFTINGSKTKISISNVVSPAGNITVPVNSELVDGATYFSFSIKYNPAVMELVNVTRNTVIGSGQFNCVNESGIIRIVWFSTTPVNFSGTLFSMNFKNYTGANAVFEFSDPNEVKDVFNKVMDIEYVNGSVGVTEVSEEKIPEKFELAQNYPNPFNPNTTIRFAIAGESHVEVTIYNMLGEKISTLVDEQKKPGFYKVSWNAQNYASGIYYYSIVTKEFVQTRKMILLK